MPVSEEQVEAAIERVSGRHVNETRLRLALDAADMGTWERDLTTGEDVWSPRQEALFFPTDWSNNWRTFNSGVSPARIFGSAALT